MNNQNLPQYPEHPEPTEAVASSEFERETRPRMMPGTLVWIGLSVFVIIFAVQKFVTPYFNQPVVVQPSAIVPGK